MMPTRHVVIATCLAMTLAEVASPQTTPAASPKPATRRSQRVQMPAVEVPSPNGQVTFTFLPNAERLTFTVRLGDTTVIEPSPIVVTLDGYDLSAGIVQTGVVRDEVHERYAWSGVRSTAISDSNRARLSLTNDLTSIAYTIEVRTFDDGVAYRHIIPGEAAASRVPDEWSTFNLPQGSTVWCAGMEGHYEAPYVKEDLAAVRAGEWAGPPLTFKLPQNGGFASITEANLVSYSGMGLESNGRGGWVIGLGHRQPLNYPFELRLASRLGNGCSADVAASLRELWHRSRLGGW
jgi:alpha-glucosidase